MAILETWTGKRICSLTLRCYSQNSPFFLVISGIKPGNFGRFLEIPKKNCNFEKIYPKTDRDTREDSLAAGLALRGTRQTNFAPRRHGERGQRAVGSNINSRRAQCQPATQHKQRGGRKVLKFAHAARTSYFQRGGHVVAIFTFRVPRSGEPGLLPRPRLRRRHPPSPATPLGRSASRCQNILSSDGDATSGPLAAFPRGFLSRMNLALC